MEQEKYKFYPNFLSRADLEKYGDNSLLLYSLQLRYNIDDIDEVASTALVDGSDDKKTDLVYVDIDNNEAIIAQGFFSKKDRTEAPANKASDLNTAISWLLTREINEIPERIRSAAKELRERIDANEVNRITIWYSHNLPQSQNVQDELTSVENTLASILSSQYPEKDIESHSLEVGLERIEDWYTGLTIPIMVTDDITIENCEGFNKSNEKWDAFITFFPATILYDLYQEHNTNLFSANVRGYLGSRRSNSNINNGIKVAASTEPNNFFVYNNGITALTNDFQYDVDSKRLVISGLSIVNGAQTTGAIGSLQTPPDDEMIVPMRLIKCDDENTVASIVRFNNSQNKINAPDFRSNDQYQKRITAEFEELNSLEYSARRGGGTDVISRNTNYLSSITAGQILAAFHGEPSIAYNEKSKIWDSDNLYSKFFNDHTNANHIFFAYTLLKVIEELKLELTTQTSELTGEQEKLLNFLRSRGSIVLFVTAVADCLESITGRKIANKFSIKFCENLSIDEAKNEWRPIIDIASSFVEQLSNGLQDGIKNREKIDSARSLFVQLMSAVRRANSEVMDSFSEKVCI